MEQLNSLKMDRSHTMSNETNNSSQGLGLTTSSYVIAAVCLVLGVFIGYLVRGGSPQQPASPPVTAESAQPTGMTAAQQPTPERMKHMADKQAEPLLASLKQNPTDADLLYKIGNIYYDTRQFPEAVNYYEQSLKLKSGATDVRTDMGTAYYFMGQPDRAISEFDLVLKQDPKHANALFNEGMVKWEGKGDINGAVAAWKKLLATNPNYPKREQLETLIAKAEAHTKMAPGTRTDKPAQVQ
jgi:cytochrome c-type biogenesis protein CcmH/NrfG